jgi:class 3 adenylate cyclase/tetratricopeptide (TPR) repeat protein
MDLEKGPAHLEAARAILEEDAPESAALAYVYSGLCVACLLRGEMEKGMVHSRRALEIGERLNSRPVTAMAQVFTGNFLAHMGKVREGLALVERGWAIADEDGLTFIAFLGALFSGGHHVFRSDPGEAKRWLQRELARPRVASAPILRRMLLGFLGSAHIIAGEMDEARQLGEDGEDDSGLSASLLIASGDWEAAEKGQLARLEEAGAGVPLNAQGISRQLGQLCFRLGEHGRAEEYLRTSFRIEEHGGARTLASRLMLTRVLARTGRLKEAQKELDKCVSLLAGDEDWGGTAGDLALARGAVASAEQNWSEADGAFVEALTVARQYGLPWDEADALHQRALMHLARDEKDDRKQALALLDETIAIYQRLGAKKHLELVLADKLEVQGISSSDVLTSIDRVAISVHAEKPDLRPHAAPDGTVTIMFSDIEGSTEKTDRLGDKAWMEVLREHNTIVREQIAARAGFEVKSEGDGFMVAFGSARRALECAIELQRAMARRNESGEEPIRVRIGLHTGEAIKEGDPDGRADFFGKNVILAARIVGQAKGGEVLASSVLKALMEGSDITWSEPRMLELKGLSGTHEIWPVVWERP